MRDVGCPEKPRYCLECGAGPVSIVPRASHTRRRWECLGCGQTYFEMWSRET